VIGLIGVADAGRVITAVIECALIFFLGAIILIAKEEIKDWLGRKK
jgi:hypothetical protein